MQLVGYNVFDVYSYRNYIVLENKNVKVKPYNCEKYGEELSYLICGAAYHGDPEYEAMTDDFGGQVIPRSWCGVITIRFDSYV